MQKVYKGAPGEERTINEEEYAGTYKKNFFLYFSRPRDCRNRSNAFTPEVRLKLSSHIPWHSLAHLPWVHEDVQCPIWLDGKCNQRLSLQRTPRQRLSRN